MRVIIIPVQNSLGVMEDATYCLGCSSTFPLIPLPPAGIEYPSNTLTINSKDVCVCDTDPVNRKYLKLDPIYGKICEDCPANHYLS